MIGKYVKNLYSHRVSRDTNARHPEGCRLLSKERKNLKKIGGFCVFLFNPLYWRGKGVGVVEIVALPSAKNNPQHQLHKRIAICIN